MPVGHRRRSHDRLGDQPADRSLRRRSVDRFRFDRSKRAARDRRRQSAGRNDRHRQRRPRAARATSRCASRITPARFADRVSRRSSPAILRRPSSCASRSPRASEAAQASARARKSSSAPTTCRFIAPSSKTTSHRFKVPVLVARQRYFEVDGATHVDVQNVAVPRISPDSLMVSDYPERLDGKRRALHRGSSRRTPSRFLYFHYNPPGQPDRRIVLRAENRSSEPTIVQFISGRGGPSPNEMEAGHTSTKASDQRRAEPGTTC